MSESQTVPKFKNGKPKSRSEGAKQKRRSRKKLKLEQDEHRRQSNAEQRAERERKNLGLKVSLKALEVLQEGVPAQYNQGFYDAITTIATAGRVVGQPSGDAARLDEATLEASSATSVASSKTIPSSITFKPQASSTTSSVGAASLQSEPPSFVVEPTAAAAHAPASASKRKRSDGDGGAANHVPKKQAGSSAEPSSHHSTMPVCLSDFRNEPIDTLLKIKPSSVDYSEFYFKHHSGVRGLERSGYAGKRPMVDVMKMGKIIPNPSPKYGGCMISYLAPNKVEHRWPLELSKGRVTVPTFIALSPLTLQPHQHYRDQMYHGLDELSRRFGVSIKEIGSVLARAVRAGDTRLLSEVSIVDTVIRILPSAEEVEIIQKTPYAETMGDVESWVAEIGSMGLNRARAFLPVIRNSLQLLESLKTSQDREALKKSVEQSHNELMASL